MTELLNATARVLDSDSMRAAMHLLTYTELPGRKDFAAHVDIKRGPAVDGSTPVLAVVRDWDALLDDDTVYGTGADARLIVIAASYVTGRPIDLNTLARGLGTAHARRVVEAVAIGAGVGEHLLTDNLATDPTDPPPPS